MATRLSFLILATEWNSGHGGVSTFNRELCTALAKLGHEVYCGAPEIRSGELEAARAANVNLIVPLQVPGVTGNARLLLTFNGLPPLDVVIGHGRVTGSEARAQVEDFHRGARHVHFIHVDARAIEPFKKRDKEAMLRAEGYVSTEIDLCKSADLVVAVGPVLQQAYATYLHPQRIPVHSFLPGLFEDHAAAAPPPRPTCLVFGRAEDDELKGLHVAAKAMGEIGATPELAHARFVVRGAQRDDEAGLRARLMEAGGAKLPLIIEPYSSDRRVVLDAIRQATVVVMPSHEEGFGLSALEAISEGVPVIVSKSSGLARALEQHVPNHAVGVVVDVRDGAEVLTPRLRNILVEDAAAFARARALRDAMVPHFDWVQSAREFVDAIQRLPHGPKVPPPTPAAGGSVIDAVANAFAEASCYVLAWQQTLHANGEWIDRPELKRILEYARNGGEGPLVVLSAPGGGKSALLARAARLLIEEKSIVLAIKADRLPADVDSIAKLTDELRLPTDVESALVAAAGVRNTVLIIDQMDALADLVDVDTRRLDVLLDLVEHVAKDDRIRVVISCREFDYRHDVRMHRLRAEELVLAVPEQAKVDTVLTAHGVDPTLLAPKTRDLLNNMQALDVFLQVTPAHRAQPGMDTYQKLLEALWNDRLSGRPNRAALEKSAGQLAGMMAKREELWLTDAVISTVEPPPRIEELQAAGVISHEGGKVAFSHQTLFEFARARHFLAEEESLPAYVRARQTALFVRPTLWTSLAYLRATDRQPYLQQLEELWSDNDLRPHLRRLLIDFMGQVEDPDPREAVLLVPGLHDERWRAAAIEAITGQAQWFELVSKVHLPTLMVGPCANMTTTLLSQAVDFVPDTVADLLESHWLPNPTRHGLIARVLFHAPAWPERFEVLATSIVESGKLEQSMIDALVNTALTMSPRTAVALVGIQLRQLRAAVQLLLETADEDRRRSIHRELLDRAGRIKSLIDAAAAAPRTFVEVVWSWFVSVIREIAHPETDGTLSYREDHSLGASLESGFAELPQALQEALAECAKEPGFIAEFVQKWANESSMAVHRFIAVTLESALPHTLHAALDYMTADQRRFNIGDRSFSEGISMRLIQALAPLLNDQDRERLEAALLRSDIASPSLYKAEDLLYAYAVNGRHRLRLMRALGSHASGNLQRLREQEERRFPGDEEPFDPNMREIKSRVNAEQMLRARDEDILHLFEDLPDHTGHRHPVRRMEGGSSQASREFAAAAKRDPDRFIRMLPRFVPGTSERPVIQALSALAETQPLARLETSIFELLQLGFFKEHEQRADVAWAIERAARGTARQDSRPQISDALRSLLESWLVDAPVSAPTQEQSENEPEKNDILLGTFGDGTLPGGNYPILDALTTAYLDRDQPDLDGWLRLLETHVMRREDPHVWLALSIQLHNVLFAPPQRAERFLDDLFARFPEVRDSRGGVTLIARAMSRVSAATITRWMADVEASTWERKTQAIGELLPWFATRPDAPGSVRERLANEVLHGSEAMRRGIAYSAANLWHVIDRRSDATYLLVALVPGATSTVAEAILSTFRLEPPLLDVATRHLLHTLSEHPHVVASGKPFGFVETLRHLLPGGADVVAPVALNLVRFSAAQSDQSYALSQSGELIDIAMTLQRLGPRYREQGLDLFELLLAQDAFGARDVLAELDPPGRRSPLRSRRWIPKRPRRGRR